MGRLLVGMSHPQHRPFLGGAPDDLEADGQPLPSEAAREAAGRKASQVEGPGEANEAARLIRSAPGYGVSSGGGRGGDEDVPALEKISQVFTEAAAEPLGQPIEIGIPLPDLAAYDQLLEEVVQ